MLDEGKLDLDEYLEKSLDKQGDTPQTVEQKSEISQEFAMRFKALHQK